MDNSKAPKLGKRIKKKRKIITETKKVKNASKQMVAHPLADLTLTSKIYEILQLFLGQKQIKKGKSLTLYGSKKLVHLYLLFFLDSLY